MTTKLLIDRELLERCLPFLSDTPDLVQNGAEALGGELRAILAAPPQPEGDGLEVRAIEQHHRTDGRIEEHELCRLPDAQRAIAELREEISDLHTTMMAAAVEIQEHWQAHCDEEGYGPANLMNRLERGIAAQYGYTAQTVVQIEAERDTLRQQIAERDATIARLEAGIPRIQEQSHQMRQQRDRLTELLRMVRQDGWYHPLEEHEIAQIDAALAEVKSCPESPAPTT